MAPLALIFATLEETGSPTDLGLVLAAAIGPRIALVLVGGSYADRFSRRRLMISADLIRAATQIALGFSVLTGAASIWQFVCLSAASGAASAFFYPALTGLVPTTVVPTDLQRANALLGLSRSGAEIAGPGLAGLMIALAGPGPVLIVDGATFLVGAISLAYVRPIIDAAPIASERLLADLRSGWHVMTSQTWLWVSILYHSVFNFAFATLFVLGPVIAERSLGGAAAWGALSAAAGIGSIAGGALALRVRPKRPCLVTNLLLSVVAVEFAALAIPLPLLAIAGFAIASFAALRFAITVWDTTLQENVPLSALSKISAYDWMGSFAFQPAGYALAGFLGSFLGVAASLAYAGAFIALGSFSTASVPSVRMLRNDGFHDVRPMSSARSGVDRS